MSTDTLYVHLEAEPEISLISFYLNEQHSETCFGIKLNHKTQPFCKEHLFQFWALCLKKKDYECVEKD